jgi:ATP-binding cassette subfamily C protein CydD
MKVQPRLFREARASGWLFPLAVITAFVAGGMAVYQSHVLSRVIAGVFLEDETLNQVTPLLQIILIVVLCRAILTFVNEGLAGNLAVSVKTSLRRQLLDKIDRLGPEYLKNESTAELTTTALLGVDALDAYFSQYLPQVLVAVALPITILVVVFPLDLLTGVVFLLTAPLIPLFMVLIGKAVESLTGKQWKALTRLGNYFLDTLQGITTLKLLGRSKERVSDVGRVSDLYRTATLNVLRVTFLTALTLELVATLSTAVVAVEIGLRLLYARIEFQEAFFILLIAPEFYLPMRNLSARYHAGMSGVTAAEKIFEVLDATEARLIPEKVSGSLADHLAGNFHLRLHHLSHSYMDGREHALRDISFEIVKGRQYALVGKTGAGKSTLARVLLRYIEPEEGQVLLDGVDIRNWPRDAWRNCVGWLPQSPHIFNDSLWFNLTLGETRYSNTEIDSALDAAGLTEFVKRLPDGLETNLLESGSRLSGGEQQRVALARSYLRDPQLLIMDEPTRHLDPAWQKSIEHALTRLIAGRTCITIAHRVSSVLQADEVILLEAGRLIARGSHIELLEQSLQYRALMQGGGMGA